MIKKADIFIILFVFIAILTLFFVPFFNNSPKNGNVLKIYVNGKNEYSYKLPLYEKKEIELKSEYGYNKIIIENNSVYVEKSDCLGKDCVNIGKITRSSEAIICAPNKVVIRIENEKTEELDAVTY